MPRRPRILLPDYPLHIVQRGINREPCFFADEDYQCYLHWIEEAARDCRCAVHAYVLMTNHVHLLLTPNECGAPARLMQSLGRRYVQYVNRAYRRSGTLWEGRYRSSPTQAESHLLACYRYIELNPVRAGMVAHPAEYRWSSHRANAQGEGDALIQPHALFMALGPDAASRQSAYRELFRHALEPGLVDQIRRATNGNFALGSARFAEQIATTRGRRVSPGKSGRPRKAPEPDSGDLLQ